MTGFEPALLVGLGGALGAVLRYAVSRALSGHELPVATLSVNGIGTFVLGLVTFADAGGGLVMAVGTGACGAFTTFSSFSFETVDLWATGRRRAAVGNAIANLIGAGLALGLAWGVLLAV